MGDVRFSSFYDLADDGLGANRQLSSLGLQIRVVFLCGSSNSRQLPGVVQKENSHMVIAESVTNEMHGTLDYRSDIKKAGLAIVVSPAFSVVYDWAILGSNQ